MKVDLGIWDKLSKLVWCLIVLAVLIGVYLWYLPPIQQNERMRKEVLRLDAEIAKQEALAKETRESIEAMRDPKVVARIARDKLGYAKPDEIVIRFEPGTNGVIR